VHIIRFSELPEIPWKNGAGVRRDLASGDFFGPTHVGSALSSWTLGLAELHRNAPFSFYPGVSRWFMPIGAGRLTLLFKTDQVEHPVELDGSSSAHHFSGEDTLEMFLHDGAMKALNVMTTGRVREVKMDRLLLSYPSKFVLRKAEHGCVHFLFLAEGKCRVTSGGQSTDLRTFDSLRAGEKDDVLVGVNSGERCELICVRLVFL
jgi:environmental stress-induced protein Ves